MTDADTLVNQKDVLINIEQGSKSSIGVITLNRPKALNALTYDMIQDITAALVAWAKEPEIKAVVIKSNNEKAFCAGGDIKSLYQHGKDNPKHCLQFFFHEYRLNTLIKRYPKPYIALLNGITMGGGIGVSLHGSHVVASHDMALAMPESSIGFFTDIGASYFLSRCCDKAGYYLGLTGDKINCNDAKYLNLVQYIIAEQDYTSIYHKIISNLTNLKLDNDKNIANQQVNNLINEFSTNNNSDVYLDSTKLENKIINNKINIRSVFDADSLMQIFTNLKQSELVDHNWSEKILQLLNTKSPTSLVLIYELLKRGCELDFEQCMQMEYGLALGFMQHNDFYEGVRALLIDKDNKPDWDKINIANCDNFDYDSYFNSNVAQELEFITLS